MTEEQLQLYVELLAMGCNHVEALREMRAIERDV